MSNTVASELAFILTKEQSTMDQLNELLAQEAGALEVNDMQQVDELAQKKQPLLVEFQSQVTHRLEYLTTQNQTSDEAGLLALIQLHSAQAGSKADLEQAWHSLKDGFRLMIRQNERNGIIIQHCRQRNQQWLHILKGKPQSSSLYTPAGTTSHGQERHHLGEV